MIRDDRARVEPRGEDREELLVTELIERVLAECFLAFEHTQPDGDEVVREGGGVLWVLSQITTLRIRSSESSHS